MKEYLKTSSHAAVLMGRPDRETSMLNFERQPSLVKSGTNTSLVPEKEEINSEETPQAEQNRAMKIKETKAETPQKQTEDKGRAIISL